jgi:hypothetical protein
MFRESLTLARTSSALAVIAAALVLSPVARAADPACVPPTLTQPFLSFGDSGWYALVAGESYNSFDGAGWTLSGGATLRSVTVLGGVTGQVLDLPSGAKAVSPTMCVNSTYLTARTMVRNVVGAEGVFFYVSYQNTATWATPKNTGQVHGTGTSWTLATPVNMQPSTTAGWQVVRLTLIPGGKTSDFQIYNLYVDPYSKR